jgi:hypothetical protein
MRQHNLRAPNGTPNNNIHHTILLPNHNASMYTTITNQLLKQRHMHLLRPPTNAVGYTHMPTIPLPQRAHVSRTVYLVSHTLYTLLDLVLAGALALVET